MLPSLLILAAMSISPQPCGVIEDRCAIIELNHYHDDEGRLVFAQLVFWDWSSDECRYQVCDWRMVKTCQPRPDVPPTHYPTPELDRAGARCVWVEGEAIRCVRASSRRESWTLYDVELYDREAWPKENRRGLSALPRRATR